jgi:hypothetical protein
VLLASIHTLVMQRYVFVFSHNYVDGVVSLFNIVQTFVYATCHFSISEYISS